MGDKLGRLVPDSGTPIYIGPLAITPADLLAGEGLTPASANPSSGSSSCSFTAVDLGIGGNLIALLSDVQPDTAETTVSVDGTTITLHLAADSEGNVTAHFSDVAAAVAASPEASALVTHNLGIGSALYDVGDVYLGDGSSKVVVATLPAESVIWDAQEFFPEAWDANTLLQAQISGLAIFYDGDPPTNAADDVGGAGIAVAQTDVVFNTSRRVRLTEDGDLAISAFCDAGAVPTVGEMLFYAEIIAPS